ncbi:MAG: hypothetical protein DRJ97_05755 [Thermoprotei archaeon]|nr:MAG: hypothetical protein DRJ69_04475 [Thermoprotei archaeon]RLF14700.1 MAG: hypothetical protein DRJ97_05755 [Thermoprotei archaeon]
MGKPCEPTCPFFRCSNRAMIFKGGRFGKPGLQKGRASGSKMDPPIVLCSMLNDPCQGAKCRYAFCEKRALLPDGTCGLEDRLAPKRVVDIEAEAAKMERSLMQLKGRLKRRGLLEEI